MLRSVVVLFTATERSRCRGLLDGTYFPQAARVVPPSIHGLDQQRIGDWETEVLEWMVPIRPLSKGRESAPSLTLRTRTFSSSGGVDPG
jgi:hypothetical protein